MPSTNKTTNLNLSQFTATDKPAWLSDYNDDMEKIDEGVLSKAVYDPPESGQTVGPVERAGGIPNYTNIETGSNANGSYIKHLDGTLICFKNVVLSGYAMTVQQGGVYLGDEAETSIGDWPMAFIDVPSVPHPSSASSNSPAWVARHIGMSATSCGLIRLASTASRAAASYRIGIVGYGRWK